MVHVIDKTQFIKLKRISNLNIVYFKYKNKALYAEYSLIFLGITINGRYDRHKRFVVLDSGSTLH